MKLPSIIPNIPQPEGLFHTSICKKFMATRKRNKGKERKVKESAVSSKQIQKKLMVQRAVISPPCLYRTSFTSHPLNCKSLIIILDLRYLWIYLNYLTTLQHISHRNQQLTNEYCCLSYYSYFHRLSRIKSYVSNITVSRLPLSVFYWLPFIWGWYKHHWHSCGKLINCR